MIAYLLIALNEGDERKISDKLSSFEEVKESYILFGEWDVLAKLEIANAEELGNFVMQKVRPLKGIRITSTLIAAK